MPSHIYALDKQWSLYEAENNTHRPLFRLLLTIFCVVEVPATHGPFLDGRTAAQHRCT